MQVNPQGLNTIEVLGLSICPLSLSEVVEFVESTLDNRTESLIITGMNAHNVNLAQGNTKYREYINKSSIVNIDGFSIVLALRFLGYPIKNRTSCPDLFDKLIELANKKGYTVYFLGSRYEIVKKAAHDLNDRFPSLQIAGYHSGYFDKEQEKTIIQDIKSKNPSMLFLGMPSPLKETFAFEHLQELNIPVILGVGGLFDIEAGIIKRAPVWFQKNGLEWLYRFVQEPRRLWYRYMIGNFVFLLIVLREKLKSKKKQQLTKVSLTEQMDSKKLE